MGQAHKRSNTYIYTILKASVSTVVMRHFLQITPHNYFKLIRCTSIDAKRRPTRARCSMMHAGHNYGTGCRASPLARRSI
jgi:hypothetical protein